MSATLQDDPMWTTLQDDPNKENRPMNKKYLSLNLSLNKKNIVFFHEKLALALLFKSFYITFAQTIRWIVSSSRLNCFINLLIVNVLNVYVYEEKIRKSSSY